MTADAPPSGRRSSLWLATGSVVSGLLAYVFFALVTRGLGAATAAPVSVLWAWWGFAAAGVTFPVQHWVARSVAAAAGEGPVRAALPRVAGLVGGMAVVAGVIGWLLRDPLFGGRGVVFPILVTLVAVFSGLMGLVRGLLAARGRYASVGSVLVVENAVRCLVAVVLLGAGVEDPAAYGWALVAGYAACLAWPSAWRPRARDAGSRPRSTSGGAAAFLGGAAGGQVVGQAVLTGGPVVLALAGGAPREVTALFAGLALFRAPYTLAVGQVAAVTSRVTDLVVTGRHDTVTRLRNGVLAATLVGAPAAALVGALAGPPVLRLVFGADAALDTRSSALVAVGTTFAVAGLVLTVMVMAHDRAPRIAAAWLVALVPGVAAYLLVAGDLDRVVVAFVVVEVVAWGGLALAARPSTLDRRH